MRIRGIIVVNQSHHGSSHEDNAACPTVPLPHPKPYPILDLETMSARIQQHSWWMLMDGMGCEGGSETTKKRGVAVISMWVSLSQMWGLHLRSGGVG